MNKNLLKNIVVLFLSFVLVFTGVIGFNNLFNVKADTGETLEEKQERLTSTDVLENCNITIQEFATNYKGGVYGATPNLTNYINDIIPGELLYTEGMHAYMGREYGYFIHTYEYQLEDNTYISNLLIIDFNIKYTIDGYGQPMFGNPIYCVEPLLQIFIETEKVSNTLYTTIGRNNTAITDELNIRLKNVSMAASLKNQNELNSNDEGYDISKDNGEVLIDMEFTTNGRIYEEYEVSDDIVGSVLSSTLGLIAWLRLLLQV